MALSCSVVGLAAALLAAAGGAGPVSLVQADSKSRTCLTWRGHVASLERKLTAVFGSGDSSSDDEGGVLVKAEGC